MGVNKQCPAIDIPAGLYTSFQCAHRVILPDAWLLHGHRRGQAPSVTRQDQPEGSWFEPARLQMLFCISICCVISRERRNSGPGIDSTLPLTLLVSTLLVPILVQSVPENCTILLRVSRSASCAALYHGTTTTYQYYYRSTSTAVPVV